MLLCIVNAYKQDVSVKRKKVECSTKGRMFDKRSNVRQNVEQKKTDKVETHKVEPKLKSGKAKRAADGLIKY